MKMVVLKFIFAAFVVMIMSAVTWVWIFNAVPFFRKGRNGYEDVRSMGLAIGAIALWVGLVMMWW